MLLTMGDIIAIVFITIGVGFIAGTLLGYKAGHRSGYQVGIIEYRAGIRKYKQNVNAFENRTVI